jgi:histidyl-tRNA synthetase
MSNQPITCKGFRIIEGREASMRETFLRDLVVRTRNAGFSPVHLPSVEPTAIYAGKLGEDTGGKVFAFKDRGDRDVVLRPEGTATLQALARERAASVRDWKVYYTASCFRYEQPQAGRYREFTQFGVEWLNPRNPDDAWDQVQELGIQIMRSFGFPDADLRIERSASRGLSYYTGGTGLEVRVSGLGACDQVLGGGRYAEGCGFAIGVDRLTLARMRDKVRDVAAEAGL